MRTESDYATISRDLKEAIVTMMASVYPLNDGIVCDEKGFKQAMAEFSRTAKWVEGLNVSDMECDASIENANSIKTILTYLLPILPEYSSAHTTLTCFTDGLNIPEELLTDLPESDKNIPEQLNEIRVILARARTCAVGFNPAATVANIRIAYAGIKAIEKRERTELHEYKEAEKLKQEARRDQYSTMHGTCELLENRLKEFAAAGKLTKEQSSIFKDMKTLVDSLKGCNKIGYELEGGE